MIGPRVERLLTAMALAMLVGSAISVKLMAGPRCSGSHASMNAVGAVVLAAALSASLAVLLAGQLAVRALAVAEVAGAAAVFYYAWTTFAPMFDCGA